MVLRRGSGFLLGVFRVTFFSGRSFHRSFFCPAANSTEGRIDDNITFDLERSVSPNTRVRELIGDAEWGWVTSRRLENGQWLGGAPTKPYQKSSWITGKKASRNPSDVLSRNRPGFSLQKVRKPESVGRLA